MPTDADRIRALTEEILDLRAEIEELRRLVPRPKLDALDKARRVEAAIARYRRAGLPPGDAIRAAKEHLGLPASTFYRATRMARAADRIASRTSEDPMKINVGQGTPASLDKYGSARRPSPPASDTPRGDNSLANGETGGNFKPYLRPNNPGTDPTNDGAAEAVAARETK